MEEKNSIAALASFECETVQYKRERDAFLLLTLADHLKPLRALHHIEASSYPTARPPQAMATQYCVGSSVLPAPDTSPTNPGAPP